MKPQSIYRTSGLWEAELSKVLDNGEWAGQRPDDIGGRADRKGIGNHSGWWSTKVINPRTPSNGVVIVFVGT